MNDVPHIGHAYTTIAADFIARYQRLFGKKVHFLAGLDEHGQKVARAAEEHCKDPQTWVDEIAPAWKDLWKSLGISYDDFIRTTEQRHIGPVQAFWQKIYASGDVYLGRYEGLYCVPCETFYLPDDLIDGNLCPIHEKPVETINEENYFFKLSAYQDRLLAHYEQNPDFIQPEARRNEVLSFVKAGLKDLSITRSTFTWGIKAPWDESHVLYVWIDALLNYATAAGYGADAKRFSRLWPADYNLIGKDILRHHAVYWPAMLIAAGVEPPKTVFAHGFLTTGGQKMSKTNATGIPPSTLLDVVGVDGYRYHFLREGTFGNDGVFSWEAMLERYNADLANDLGNLVSRTLALVDQNFEGVVPGPGDAGADESNLDNKLQVVIQKISDHLERLELQRALAAVFEFVDETNHYIDRAAPWKLAKDPSARQRLATVLHHACKAVNQISALISPATPGAAARIREQLGLPSADSRPLKERLAGANEVTGCKAKRGQSIFPRIDAKDVG